MTATVVSSRTKLLEGFEAENSCFEEDMLSRKRWRDLNLYYNCRLWAIVAKQMLFSGVDTPTPFPGLLVNENLSCGK